jgi:hypothetical protein
VFLDNLEHEMHHDGLTIVATVDQNFDSMEGIVNTDYQSSHGHGSQSTLVSKIYSIRPPLPH